jgi:hypothetical protein
MKRFTLFVFCFALSVSAATLAAQSFTYRSIPNKSYKVGERLRYSIKYGLVKAVNTQIEVTKDTVFRGRPAVKVEYTARTVPFYDNFYRVDDKYETYIDTAGQFPHAFTQQIREGKYSHDESMVFYHDEGKAKSIVQNKEFPMEAYCQDILSAYFYARTLDLRAMKNGETMELKNVSDKETIPLVIKIVSRDVLETNLGNFKCIIVEPQVKGVGLFKSDGKIQIWMTDDENKIPLKIRFKVVVGAFTAEIDEMTGLKNPVTSKLVD